MLFACVCVCLVLMLIAVIAMEQEEMDIVQSNYDTIMDDIDAIVNKKGLDH